MDDEVQQAGEYREKDLKQVVMLNLRRRYRHTRDPWSMLP